MFLSDPNQKVNPFTHWKLNQHNYSPHLYNHGNNSTQTAQAKQHTILNETTHRVEEAYTTIYTGHQGNQLAH